MARADATSWKFEWRCGDHWLRDPEFLREWQDLVNANAAARIFQEPVFVRLWFETRGRDFRLSPALLCVRRADGARAIFPFGIGPARLLNGFRRRAVGAGEPNFDYQDPAVVWSSTGEDWPSLWTALSVELRCQRRFELVGFVRLSASIAPPEAQPDPAIASPIIPLRRWPTAEAFLETRSGNLRVDVRRRARRLSERGREEVVVFGPGETEAARAELARLRAAYAREWAGAPAAAEFGSAALRRFYERMIEDLLPAGWLHFSALRLDGRSIAWVFGFLYRGIYHYYKPVFDPDFRDFSPGKLLCWRLIEMGFREGWREFDFGAGVEPYKLQWTDERTELRQVWWPANTWRGRLCRALRRAVGKPW